MAVAFEMEIVEALEDAHWPVRPVELVKVDVVGLQTLQARLDRLHDLARACRVAVSFLRTQTILPRPTTLVAITTLSRAFRAASQVPMIASVRPWVSGLGGIG